MSLSQALGTAVAGLRVTQSGMALVAANVANAETPGYIKKTLSQSATAANGAGTGVRLDAINRELDAFVQRQLRGELSGALYAGTRAEFYERLQAIYGAPGSEAALETVYNAFTTALQALTTSPESPSARAGVMNAADVLAQQLNAMTYDVQALRTDAELGLSAAVQEANNAIRQIADVNQQLASVLANDSRTALLLDQRDRALEQLAQLMDIRVLETGRNQVTVFTGSGHQLVGAEAGRLSFDPHGTVTPASQWSVDPALRTLGTITLENSNGARIDLIAESAVKSGRIAALIEMRDHLLPEAQAQLDEIAGALARTLSDVTTVGTPASASAQTGFEVDTAALLDGNTIHLTYTDTTSGTLRRLTIVRVDDPATPALASTFTADPADQVVAVSFGGGAASVAAQLNAALGVTGLQFSNPSGALLRVLDDGLGNRVDVNALSTRATTTSLTSGNTAFPFFVDGGVPFSGAVSAIGLQVTGFAGRIAVNSALKADPSRLVVYGTSPLTPPGDNARPSFIYDSLMNTVASFSPRSGIGTATAPFTGTLSAYMRQVISDQGEAATTAARLEEGQTVVLNTLQKHFAERSGVNIDEEMAMLLKLQTAYGANARVMTTVKDMLDLLLRI